MMTLIPHRTRTGSMTPLFLFGTPGNIGGAATKIKHLIELLKHDFDITVVVTNSHWLKDWEVQHICAAHQIPVKHLSQLPDRLDGIGLSICEPEIFTSGVAKEIKKRGLQFVFSNEMMWPFRGEADAVRDGLIDKVLFVSDFQSQKFQWLYKSIPQHITGNFVDPDEFPYAVRSVGNLTLGRLSRPDPDKYPEDFPVFYEELDIPKSRFRVMAWSPVLSKKYRWHRFDSRWDLLGPGQEKPPEFLSSLDLFVYPLGHTVRESWGRSTVEAMLTGCIPLVPSGHHFHNLVRHEHSGFVCNGFEEYQYYARELAANPRMRMEISRQAACHARTVICNREQHLEKWKGALLN